MSIHGVTYVTKYGVYLQSTFISGILSWYLLIMASVITIPPTVDSSLYKDHENIRIVLYSSTDSGASGAKLYSTEYLLGIYLIITLTRPCFTLAKKYLGKGWQYGFHLMESKKLLKMHKCYISALELQP